MRRARFLVTLLLAAQAVPAFAQQPAASEAAQAPLPNSPLIWEIRDGTHPRLGPIRVAVPSTSVVTPVGKEKILSLVFFSCERSKGLIAIELVNAAESDTRGGLYPKQMPKLYCNPRSTAPRVEIPSTWFVSEIGDALARGFAPADFRRCASLEIAQDISLPRGWTAETKHVEIEVIPYKKEIDEVLGTCAEGPLLAAQAHPPAPAPAPQKPAAASTPAPSSPTPALSKAPAAAPTKPAPAPAPATAPAASNEAPWRSAHTITHGRSNVRSAASIDSTVLFGNAGAGAPHAIRRG